MQTETEANASSETNWYDLQEPETRWLVDGLIPSGGCAIICGKPKAGKSTVIRNLVASIIKKRPFLNPSIDIPTGTGTVLYIHLDRKDTPGRVAEELRGLDITRDESPRLIFRTAQDIPQGRKQRLEWISTLVGQAKPHLIVIDLLWQFLDVSNANDYVAVMNGISELQDALTKTKYSGALLVAVHARKAVNLDNPMDDILGSTSQSGSFVTAIMVKRDRVNGRYTLMTDQTVRDETYGEIEESLISRAPDGTLTLGNTVAEMRKQAALTEAEADGMRLLDFIQQHPGCEISAIEKGLKMSKKTALARIKERAELIRIEGEGKKGDPHKYFVDALDDTTKLISRFGSGRIQ